MPLGVKTDLYFLPNQSIFLQVRYENAPGKHYSNQRQPVTCFIAFVAITDLQDGWRKPANNQSINLPTMTIFFPPLLRSILQPHGGVCHRRTSKLILQQQVAVIPAHCRPYCLMSLRPALYVNILVQLLH